MARQNTGRKPVVRINTNAEPRTSEKRVVRGRNFHYLTLNLHSVKCVKTTREVDRDEIVLAAIRTEGALKGTGNRKKLVAKAAAGERVQCGKFRKDDVRRFGDGHPLCRFEIGDAALDWPRYYQAILLLIEKDEGAIGTIVNAAARSVEDDMTAALNDAASGAAMTAISAAAGGASLGTAVPLVGTAIGAAVGAGAKLAIDGIKRSRKDDVFPPAQMNHRLNRAPARPGAIEGSREKIVFRGFNGIYRVTCSWSVF